MNNERGLKKKVIERRHKFNKGHHNRYSNRLPAITITWQAGKYKVHNLHPNHTLGGRDLGGVDVLRSYSHAIGDC